MDYGDKLPSRPVVHFYAAAPVHNLAAVDTGKTRWGLVNFHDFVNFTNFRPSVFYPKDERHIGLPKNSQGYQALYRRHKLLWEKSRRYRFYYTDADVIPSMSYCQIVSSDNRKEILFLFAVLNSSITRYVFEAMYALGNEKVGMFIAVSRLKSFVRPPLVDDAVKKRLKDRIIRDVGKALEMEKRILAELVEIDTLARRVSNPRVLGRDLVVTHRGMDLQFPVMKGATKLVEAALEARFGGDGGLLGEERTISTSELKALPAFDQGAQRSVLGQVDEWILDLYGIAESKRRRLRQWQVA